MESTDRPWAQGIGLLLLGLAVSAAASALGLQGEPSPVLVATGILGYALGVAVAGIGVHRVLWVHPSDRGWFGRLVVTALVTVPVFVGSALVLSVLLTLVHRRFG